MSVVRIGLAPRASGVSRSAAQRHWRGEHGRLFAQLPDLLSYVQNHAVLDSDDDPVLGDPGFDIFSEVEYENAAELDAVAGSAYYREKILEDEKTLLDASRRTFLITRRRPFGAVPRAGAFKLALFLSAAQGRGHKDLPDIALAKVPSAECSAAYVVEAVGGAVPRSIDLLMAHYYGTLEEALEAHRFAAASLQHAGPDGLSLHAATLVREIEILPRDSQRSRAA